ncbi:MAG: hypothetical protein ACPGU4_10000 [Flavobacteriales bacterium]
MLFVSTHGYSQDLAVLIKFKVDGSNYSGSKVTITENGKVLKVYEPAKSKMIQDLSFGNDYMITFEKEGYITKRVEASTKSVPEDIKGEDLDFDFAVEIFEQYEGVNTVIFNQPVAKWFYDPQEDEFTYDTDYTKSIRSALIKFDEEYEEVKKNPQKPDDAALKAKAAEEARLAAEAEAKAAEEARKLAEAQAAEEERLRLEEEARLATEAREKQEAELAQQQALEEQQQKEALAKQEEETRQAKVKEEDDQRKALEAKAEEEKRLAQAKAEEEKRAAAAKAEEEAKKQADLAVAQEAKLAEEARLEEEERARKKAELEEEMRLEELNAANEAKRREQLEKEEMERRQREADARRAEEERLAIKEAAEAEKRRLESEAKAAEEKRRYEIEQAAFEEDRKKKAKAAFDEEQKRIAKAKAVSEAQKREREAAVAKMEAEKNMTVKDAGAVVSRTEEIIKEANRTITQVTMQREHMAYIYKKVVYNWGGVYYFRDDTDITKFVFESESNATP